ncbi:MAG: metal-dependent transcriptional regulator [Clostridiales bacterium]|nr:metal-dependent transcriptional regulator [Clostridiales bacterium]
MKIYESAEDYLEAILILRERKGMVRSIDVANEKGYTKASVSIAMKKLRENGYIQMDEGGFLTLLPAGEEIAQHIYERHRLLTEFFVRLGVSEETAAVDACKVEHDLSEETFQKIKEHAQKGMKKGR